MTKPSRALPTKEECLERAGRAITWGLIRSASMAPREAAEAAHIQGVGLSVDEIELLIRARRAAAAERARAALTGGS